MEGMQSMTFGHLFSLFLGVQKTSVRETACRKIALSSSMRQNCYRILQTTDITMLWIPQIEQYILFS